MPWKGVTVNEERRRFLQEFRLGYYSVSDLADRFSISRQTAHKWIRRLEHYGQTGFHERSRRPYNSPSQTDPAIVEAFVGLRKAHPTWGARKLLDLMHHRNPPGRSLPHPLPAVSSSVKASPVPDAASAALTQAVPSPCPRAPTTSAPPTTN